VNEEPLPTTFPVGDDPDLAEVSIDVDERRETTDEQAGVTVAYRYVHGGFTGTNGRFALYFPDEYLGRFFHFTYPTIEVEDAEARTIAFAISHGAYLVSTNNGGGIARAQGTGGFRLNAAAAKASRLVAALLYGDDAPVRGYLYGGSGGAYQTLGGIENTSGAWDGAVPFVPGTPNAIPNFQGSQLLGVREVGTGLAGVADAMDAGGSGDPYAGLDDRQRAILEEVTSLGFPLRGWWQHQTLDGGSFYAVAPGVRALDPTYVDDFWSVPGYEGADPDSPVRDARIQLETTVSEVGNSTVTLADLPASDPSGADLTVLTGAAEGASLIVAAADGFELTFRPAGGGLLVGEAGGERGPVPSDLRPGDQVRIDNSWFLALQYFHRHQVPSEPQDGWEQFRDADGEPIPPQREVLTGRILTEVFGGGGTGRFEGKMIMVASVMDVEAYPWSADWYRQQAAAYFGDDLDDHYRLWYQDNADHSEPRPPGAEAHIVDYFGVVEQALLDLDDWVAEGIPPSATSSYEITDDHQVVLPDTADRGGVQPVVTLTAEGENPVTFSLTAEAPPGTGEIVRVEWDFEGTGDFPVEGGRTETHTYDQPGTYFAVARVTAHRGGDPDAPYARIQNLARVRVVVR
jgi:PKD domain